MSTVIEVETTELIDISDELSRTNAYLECVCLASEDALGEHANAVLSVLTVARDKIREIVKSVDALYSDHSAKTP
jgi:hypothetical protein